MRKLTVLIASCAAATALFAAPALEAKTKPTGEERLAKMLNGREAGEPVSCISMLDTHDLHTIDKTALVYKRGGTIWVNRPANPEALRSNDVLVIKRTGSQFCKMDNVTTADQSTHMFSGAVFLGDFVPYKKAG
jgi:hypothetical protein